MGQPRARRSGREVRVVALTLAAFVCGGCPEPGALRSPLRDEPIEAIATDVERFIPDEMRGAHVPGLSIALVRNGEVAWAEGFGVANAWTREPVGADTVFEVASNGKPVAAYAALRFVETGVLELDRSLNGYLETPFLLDSPYRDTVTLRRVLSHTSGLSNCFVGLWTDRRIRFPPGERFAYSGHGFAYLQRALESATGAPFAAHMRTAVFDELGMDSSSYVLEEAFSGRLASAHLPTEIAFLAFAAPFGALACLIWLLARVCFRVCPCSFGSSRTRTYALLLVSTAGTAVSLIEAAGVTRGTWILAFGVALAAPIGLVYRAMGRLVDKLLARPSKAEARSAAQRLVLLFSASAFALALISTQVMPLPAGTFRRAHAAGSLYSTAPDLARFLIELMEPRRINAHAAEGMREPQVEVNGHVSWGLGIGIQHSPTGDFIWHWKDNPGFESLMIGVPDRKVGVVILTNAEGGLEVARRIAHRALGGEHYGYWEF